MRKGAVLLALSCIALLDCATLEPLAEGTCGNGVVDATEDCDGFAPPGLANAKCGAPTEGALACRLKCSSAADCPDGWGCGAKGVCGEPGGTFSAIGEGVSAGVETMVVGDFDGDRRKDIIGSGPQAPSGTAKVRVHYFGDGASLAHVNVLSAPISSPTVYDFDKNGADDFAFGLDFVGALGVMTGQLDRSLVPAVFPSGRVPKADAHPVNVLREKRPTPSGRDSDFLFAGSFAGRKNSLTSLGQNGYEHELPVGPDGIVGEPVWATFFPSDVDSTCGQVAIALKGGAAGNGVIQIFSPCRPAVGGGSEWASQRAPVVIDSPVPLDGGLHVFTRPGGGPAELLFAGRASDGTKSVYLVSGNGSTFGNPVKTALADLPIASGDLDLDGRIDFIMPQGIALSGVLGAPPASDGGAPVGDGNPPFTDYNPYTTGRRVRWTSARIGNFNGDNLPDFIAASDEQPDIDFLSATPGGYANSTISTAGPVTRLAVGDFDGDRLTDIAFVEKRPGSGNEFDVAIAYGRTNGPPEPARVVGRTNEVVLFTTTGDPEVRDDGLKGITLFTREEVADGGLPDLAIAVIIGNGDRQPVAPLILNDFFALKPDPNPDIEREWVPIEVHAAAVADPNRVDLIALAIGYKSSRLLRKNVEGPYPAAVWLAPGKGGTSFDAPVGVQELGMFAVSDRGVLFDARTTVGDIDNPKDGKSEFVVLQKRPGETSFALRIARPDSDTDPVELPGKSIRRDAPMTLIDVDADGNLDLVALLDEPETEARQVSVFYNDGKGGFVVPAVVVPLAEGEQAQGFAHLATRGSAPFGSAKVRRELAVVSDKRIVLASPDAADRTKLVVRDVVSEGGPPLVRPTAIASGDFDGDGVEDLAIADAGALRILRQRAVR